MNLSPIDGDDDDDDDDDDDLTLEDIKIFYKINIEALIVFWENKKRKWKKKRKLNHDWSVILIMC